MKSIRRILAIILSVLMVAAAIPVALAEEPLNIGIIIQKENGAFLDMRDGILEGLAEAGYTEETANIDYQCAQGDATTLATICNAMLYQGGR